jgi:hypothetical protein
MRHSAHGFIGGGGLQTVGCWNRDVGLVGRLRNISFLPNNIATHPCSEGQSPFRALGETLAHEHEQDADNNRAAQENLSELGTHLLFTSGMRRTVAMIRIADDPGGFAEDCRPALDDRVGHQPF